MKRFFRFWATIGPHSQPTAFYTYAADLLAAVEKIEQRLTDEHGGSASLTARHEEFELQDANRYSKVSVSLSQSMTPTDIEEVCEDLATVDRTTWDNATNRVAQDFEFQRQTVRARREAPIILGEDVHRRQRPR